MRVEHQISFVSGIRTTVSFERQHHVPVTTVTVAEDLLQVTAAVTDGEDLLCW